jgi:hypothetical protein
MFILRIVENSGAYPHPKREVRNHLLGDWYTVIDNSHPEFEDYLKKYELSGEIHETKTKFIVADRLKQADGLWGFESHEYYIMTETGKTFEKL